MSTENPEFTLPNAPDMWKQVAETESETFERIRQKRIKNQLDFVRKAMEDATKALKDKASIGILDKKDKIIEVKVSFPINDTEIDAKKMEPEVVKAIANAGWSTPIPNGSSEGLTYTFKYDPSKRTQ